MSESDRLADLVDRVLTGDPWHGPNVLTLVQDLTPDEAARTPMPGAHSIWALVLHMTGWAREVHARLAGSAAGEPAAGDWPAVPSPSADAWERDRRVLFEVHSALAAAIRRAPPAMLEQPVIDHRDRAAGTGLSKYLTLHGLVHHTVYHSGQIAQLRRALRP
jgi:uncharacterized damage-inducible protein DinB